MNRVSWWFTRIRPKYTSGWLPASAHVRGVPDRANSWTHRFIVQSLKPGLYMDGKTPAFALRVRKRRKAWSLSNNRTKVRLGHYSDLKLAEARRRGFAALGTPVGENETSMTWVKNMLLDLRKPIANASAKEGRDIENDEGLRRP